MPRTIVGQDQRHYMVSLGQDELALDVLIILLKRTPTCIK